MVGHENKEMSRDQRRVRNEGQVRPWREKLIHAITIGSHTFHVMASSRGGRVASAQVRPAGTTALRYTLVFAASRHEPAGILEGEAVCGIAPVQLTDNPSRLTRTEDVFATQVCVADFVFLQTAHDPSGVLSFRQRFQLREILDRC